MITFEKAKQINCRTTLYHGGLIGSDKKPIRCRVNGKCKTWVTRPSEFQLPVKHGLKQCFYIDQGNALDWYELESDAIASNAALRSKVQ